MTCKFWSLAWCWISVSLLATLASGSQHKTCPGPRSAVFCFPIYHDSESCASHEVALTRKLGDLNCEDPMRPLSSCRVTLPRRTTVRTLVLDTRATGVDILETVKNARRAKLALTFLGWIDSRRVGELRGTPGVVRSFRVNGSIVTHWMQEIPDSCRLDTCAPPHRLSDELSNPVAVNMPPNLVKYECLDPSYTLPQHHRHTVYNCSKSEREPWAASISPPYPPDLKCSKSQAFCKESRLIENGHFYSTNRSCGGHATVFCNAFYRRRGPKRVKCSSSGNWEPSLETLGCEKISDFCEETLPPLHGSFEATKGREVGSVAKYSCDTGYSLVGSDEITCEEYQGWKPKAPFCLEISKFCPTVPEFPDGILRAPERFINSKATYECAVGYEADGVTETFCDSSGNWHHPPPTCTQVSKFCPPLPPLENGVMSAPLLSYAAIASFECDRGFQLIGPTQTFCDGDRKWHSIPRCQKTPNSCPDLKPLVNGWTQFDKHSPEQRVVFQCNFGFTLFGFNESVCRDQHWSSPMPICREKRNSCDSAQQISNGLVYMTNRSLGGRAKYVCKYGYELVGDKHTVCTKAGFWTPLPFCQVSLTGRLTSYFWIPFTLFGLSLIALQYYMLRRRPAYALSWRVISSFPEELPDQPVEVFFLQHEGKKPSEGRKYHPSFDDSE